MTQAQIAEFKAQVLVDAEKLTAEQEKYGQVVDWTKTNKELAKQLDVTKRQVSKLRRAR